MGMHRRVCALGLVAALGSAAAARSARAAPDQAGPPAGGPADAGSATAVDAGPPRDFAEDARLFYRVVACGSDDPLPDGFDAKVVDAHCKWMAERMDRFRTRYVGPASEFFAKVRPDGLPTTVVYPFGGGDLVSALLVYPQAREITTISLEHPGDPTRLAGLDKRHLRRALSDFRGAIRGLLTNNDSASDNMIKLERGPIPGQLSFFITGLAVLGYEPVSLRYFKLDDAGQVVYLSDADIAALAHTRARKVKGRWIDTDYSKAFDNMELTFRKKGDPSAPLIVHRHIVANLDNPHFRDSALAHHLEAKGQVAALTKAASYLLWLHSFSAIRDYLLGHMVFMVSDSTGIPPYYARHAGFQQVTYGRFEGSYLDAAESTNEAFVKLWKRQRRRRLHFRFGYPDSAGNVHLMITAPKEAHP